MRELFTNTVLVDAHKLQAAGVQLNHTLQRAGEAVLIKGTNFHYGIGTECFSESINILTEDWLEVS